MKIILGTPHLGSTPGKQSPDGRLREAVYGREIVADCKAILTSYGHDVLVDYEPLEPKPEWTQARQKAGYGAEQSKELSYRVQRVNAWCDYHGKDNCLYVSIHLNAAGDGTRWRDAGGWCCYTSRGKTRADRLAECLYDAAFTNLKPYVLLMDEGKRKGEYGERQTPFRMDMSDGDRDLEANLYVIRKTACPAVLTENLFMDNVRDTDFLLSDEGRHAITRLHVEGILRFINNQ
jgi:N-acetylmuramoyl-L-alanine amidase